MPPPGLKTRGHIALRPATCGRYLPEHPHKLARQWRPRHPPRLGRHFFLPRFSPRFRLGFRFPRTPELGGGVLAAPAAVATTRHGGSRITTGSQG